LGANWGRAWFNQVDVWREDCIPLRREIVLDERIVSTEIFDGMPDAEAVSTVTLTEKDGRTTLTLLVQHTSEDNRDRHLQYGDSLRAAMDRLEQAAIAAR